MIELPWDISYISSQLEVSYHQKLHQYQLLFDHFVRKLLVVLICEILDEWTLFNTVEEGRVNFK